MLKTKKNYLILSLVIYVLLTVLGLIGLFFSIWEIVMILGISSVFGFCHLLVCFYFKSEPPKEGENNTLRMYLLSAFRGLFTVLFIVLPALILFFVPNPSLESIGKYRILFSLISFVPIAISLICFYFGSDKKWTNNLKK